jgi:HD-GYP domain-containing protein (c-di-GMP phosphodiesterase class II)
LLQNGIAQIAHNKQMGLDMNDLSNQVVTEAAAQLSSPHYLKTLTELGDNRPLVTIQDIYSSTGVKLVNKGACFNSKLFKKLVHHKLIPDLDQCIGIENPITSEQLAEQARNLFAFDARLAAFKTGFPQTDTILQVIAKVALHPVMAFKLSVMQDARPGLLQHSLYVAIISLYMGIRAGLTEEQLVTLATAALLHDIGFMHMDHKLLDHDHVLDGHERHHLYAHPVTACLILNALPEYGDELSNAVLEHHERLDGSGYPRSLRGNKISRLGQLIALAEIVSSRFEKGNDSYDGLRLETILKLNSHRYGQEYIGYLDIFYRDQVAKFPDLTKDVHEMTGTRIRAIARVLRSWSDTCGALRENHQVADFISERLSNLEVAIFDAGLDPRSENMTLLDAENDPGAFWEMRVLADEAFWQIKGVQKEILRRWPLLEHEDKTSALRPIADWISETKALLT